MSGRITSLLCLLLPSLAMAQVQQTNPPARSEPPVRAQTLTQIVPGIPLQESSFMIVVDDLTFDQCKSAIMDYKRALERDGLPTFVLSATWNDPEEVRQKIKEFYTHSKLEGVVLVGDIPVPMITTDRRPQTAIASDRFYDAFDLKLEPLGLQKDLYYYYLAVPASDAGKLLHIRSQIYSGRIKALPNAVDPYQQLTDYLSKATAVHQEKNTLDQVLSYQGESLDSVLADCLVAWHPQTVRLKEQFLGVFTQCGQARFLRYDFWDDPKPEVINQLRREDLDVAVVYGRTGIPAGEINGIAPNARFVIFDNHSEGQIAGHAAQYLFAPGKTVAALASTAVPTDRAAQIRKDQSATHMVGLLGLGARIGQWTRYNNTLESHILGDPAFRFAPPSPPPSTSPAMSTATSTATSTPTTSDKWLDSLLGGRIPPAELREIASAHPWPDVRNVALTQLYWAGDAGISDLLRQQFAHSPFAVVRLGCMQLLGEIADANHREVLKQAITDRDELVRRTAVSEMADAGKPEFIPYLIRAYLGNHYASAILSNLKKTLKGYAPTAVQTQSANVFAEAGTVNSEKSRQEFLRWAAQ